MRATYSSSARRAAGFTLIEMMITVGIVAILAAIAYPMYTDQMRKGRRAEARAALMNLLQQQERYHTQNNTYAAFAIGTPSSLPFVAHSNQSGDATRAGHQLGARLCQPVAASTPVIQDCVEVFAEPTARYPDPDMSMLAVDSLGRRRCTSNQPDRCWK